MNVKVKRGLGMLAVAALAWVIQWVVSYDDGGAADGIGALARLVFLVAVLVGLAMVALGLLRD